MKALLEFMELLGVSPWWLLVFVPYVAYRLLTPWDETKRIVRTKDENGNIVSHVYEHEKHRKIQ